MIEINLSPNKKATGISNVGGFDFSQINLRMLFFAILFLYIPEIIFESYLDDEIKAQQNEQQRLKKELEGFQKEITGMRNIQRQVDAFLEQEKKLEVKLATVKKIIAKRQNPFKVFKYIASNIPKDVWLTSLTLEDKKLRMTGYAKTWKNIGEFIESLKSSIFFAGQINYSRPSGDKQEYRGSRVEVFEIKTEVTSFN